MIGRECHGTGQHACLTDLHGGHAAMARIAYRIIWRAGGPGAVVSPVVTALSAAERRAVTRVARARAVVRWRQDRLTRQGAP